MTVETTGHGLREHARAIVLSLMREAGSPPLEEIRETMVARWRDIEHIPARELGARVAAIEWSDEVDAYAFWLFEAVDREERLRRWGGERAIALSHLHRHLLAVVNVAARIAATVARDVATGDFGDGDEDWHEPVPENEADPFGESSAGQPDQDE